MLSSQRWESETVICCGFGCLDMEHPLHLKEVSHWVTFDEGSTLLFIEEAGVQDANLAPPIRSSPSGMESWVW